MAEIKQGILGSVNGKVGTVVGVMWRGINYIRAKPRKSSKKPTDKQLLQWDKMSLVSTFASKFKDFVNAHCPAVYNGEKWITGKEQMISRLMKQGIAMINGVQNIIVESALLSIGNLAPAVIKKINRLKTGKFKVQWDNGLINALTLDTDSLTMMLYNEKLDEFVAIPNIGKRVDKYAHFSLPVEWVEGSIYFWSMWKAADASVHSTSCFHGIIELEKEEPETDNGEQETQDENQENENTLLHNLHKVETQHFACHTKQENENQEAENRKQEITEVIPIEKAREISLKNFLEENKTTPPLKSTILSEKSSDERELKKWTPPGYIRKVNKEIVKQPKEAIPTVKTDHPNNGIFDGVRSILELSTISEEQKE